MSVRIKQLRKELGLLQSELASELGTTASNISNYENGKIKPPIDKIRAMAEIFNVPIDYLTGESDSRTFKDKEKRFIEVDNYIGELIRELDNSGNTFKYNGLPISGNAKEILKANLEHTLAILQLQQAKTFNNILTNQKEI
jgi:transcriptional regulator with XRE-family HTH domain